MSLAGDEIGTTRKFDPLLDLHVIACQLHRVAENSFGKATTFESLSVDFRGW